MVPNLIGLFGVALIVVSYFLVQMRRLKADTALFSALNAFGSSCILFSLFFAWNLSAAIVEFLWILVSLIGLYKSLTERRVATTV